MHFISNFRKVSAQREFNTVEKSNPLFRNFATDLLINEILLKISSTTGEPSGALFDWKRMRR